MNRYQSNPFLSDLDNDVLVDPQNVTGLFELDPAPGVLDTSEPIKEKATELSGERRHSTSYGDSVNPFGANRKADRRLYHRNMSSFEAASLQLEHHQQIQEKVNYAAGLSKDQTDLIAKMTADFQSVIATNDKQFAMDSQVIGDDGQPVQLNTFDPFETITDDDVSIPSPAVAASGQDMQSDVCNALKTQEESQVHPNVVNVEQQQQQQQQRKTGHDSIDDDDDELVSTPVRSIKSSSPQQIKQIDERPIEATIDLINQVDQSCFIESTNKSRSTNDNLTSSGRDEEMNESHLSENNAATTISNNSGTNSIEKASMFASLLASAESGKTTNSETGASQGRSPELGSRQTKLTLEEEGESPLEAATRVIKGSQPSADGNIDRAVGFFDPFETVIDKDDLNSFIDNDAGLRPAAADLGSLHGASISVETVIDANASAVIAHASGEEAQKDISSTDGQQQHATDTPPAQGALARPRPNRPIVAAPAAVVEPMRIAPIRKHTQRPSRRKTSQPNSSDSDDDDDRIQVVIKARDSKADETNETQNVVVPLLPPPPSKSSVKQARERGQVEDVASPVMSYKSRRVKRHDSDQSDQSDEATHLGRGAPVSGQGEASELSTHEMNDAKERRSGELMNKMGNLEDEANDDDDDDMDDYSEGPDEENGQFIIPMTLSDHEGDDYDRPETPLYDEDTSYELEEFPTKYEGSGWDMLLRYPPKKKLTSNRFWKKIFVRLAQVPSVLDGASSKSKSSTTDSGSSNAQQMCIALQIFDKPEDKKPLQEIPLQATYTVSEISSQQYDQFGKIFTVKLQYIFYKERVGVRQGQLARFIHSGHIGSSTTSGGHGVDPISIGAIKRLGAPLEHSPQVSQIIKIGCSNYEDIKQFKNYLEDYLFKMPINRDKSLAIYKTEEVQMAVRDETYVEINQVGTITKQLARVRLFFLSFLNGMPTVEVGVNDIHRQGREVVGRMDILPVVTEEWIQLESCELHSIVDEAEFKNPDSRLIKLVPPDATFLELMRFRVRPPRNRELPLQVSANMSVTRTRVTINCDVIVPGSVSRKHGHIPCEDIAIRVHIPECWIYFFREEKHFRMGSKKSVNRRPGKVKGIERFLGGGGGQQDFSDDSSLIEVTSGQAKYEHHHQSIVWRAARWPKESQSAYVQNSMRIRLPLTAYDKMPENFYEYVHVEYTMPATTVSHTTLRSISVNPYENEPPEKYVKYSANYEYKVKLRLSVNLSSRSGDFKAEESPIVLIKQPDLDGDLKRQEDSNSDDESSQE